MSKPTYRQLAEIIENLPEERKDDNVTIFDPNDGEFYPVKRIETATIDECDVLDEGHIFLRRCS
jgi:hypothetical protein